MILTNSRIALDTINGYIISTVFLCTDHNFICEGDPILFETMVFSPENNPGEDVAMYRYSSLDEAQAGHNDTVRLIAQLHQQAEQITAALMERLRRLRDKA